MLFFEHGLISNHQFFVIENLFLFAFSKTKSCQKFLSHHTVTIFFRSCEQLLVEVVHISEH